MAEFSHSKTKNQKRNRKDSAICGKRYLVQHKRDLIQYKRDLEQYRVRLL